jgi:dihydroorotate dehydrogenase (fumarate)
MDLKTSYLGLELKNPVIVSACRLSERIDNIRKIAEAGAGAIVMYSIFEEEIEYDNEFVDYFKEYGTNYYREALTYFPNVDKQADFLTQHLYHLEQACQSVDIPIIGSLNAIGLYKIINLCNGNR